MGIFKGKKKKGVKMAAAPEEEESEEEIEHLEELEEERIAKERKKFARPVPKINPKEEVEYKEIPVCMSQEQINNLVIENNIMLRQIIAEMD